jgi:hypothetical protein
MGKSSWHIFRQQRAAQRRPAEFAATTRFNIKGNEIMTTSGDEAKAVAQAFLSAINQRDADAAQALLSPGGKLVFPGGTSFERVTDFLQWAQTRYRGAEYTYQAWDVVPQPDRFIVYAKGAISGELLDGTRFDGVRCMERFTIHGKRVELKEVWSDIADMLRRRDHDTSADDSK